MLKVGVVLLTVLVVTTADWYTDHKWAFDTYLDAKIALHCNASSVNLTSNDVLEWRKPGGQPIAVGDGKYSLSVDGPVRHMTLTVNNVKDEDKGVYICFVYRNNNIVITVNRGLNLYRHKYLSSIDKYLYNIMIGGIAAAVLFVPLVAMCALYKYRYKTREQREASRNSQRYFKDVHMSTVEAGELPHKTPSHGGVGIGNDSYQSDSTNL